jgi:zinc transport system substrate-binding protein
LVDALVPELARLGGDEAGVRARAAALRAEIEALDAELRATLERVRGGRFLVLHPAWGHFAEHYGLEQIAIEHDGKAPGPHQLAQLVQSAERDGLRSVIVAPETDPRSAHSVARAIGGRTLVLDPLSADWPASMRRTAQLLASEAVVP